VAEQVKAEVWANVVSLVPSS